MAERRIGIIMNGVTGRMGTNQHLVRSIAAIRAAGRRERWRTATALMPDPILVGRNAARSWRRWPRAHGVERWTTDLDAALADPKDDALLRRGDHAAARRR